MNELIAEGEDLWRELDGGTDPESVHSRLDGWHLRVFEYLKDGKPYDPLVLRQLAVVACLIEYHPKLERWYA
jgi:hypothetical protein